MKTILWLISGIAVLGGVQYEANSSNKAPASLVEKKSNTATIGDEEPIIMRGHVRNTGGSPISGASVALKELGASTPKYTTTTNSSGDYIFNAVDVGSYTMGISATGYYPKIFGITLTVETERWDTLTAQ